MACVGNSQSYRLRLPGSRVHIAREHERDFAADDDAALASITPAYADGLARRFASTLRASDRGQQRLGTRPAPVRFLRAGAAVPALRLRRVAVAVVAGSPGESAWSEPPVKRRVRCGGRCPLCDLDMTGNSSCPASEPMPGVRVLIRLGGMSPVSTRFVGHILAYDHYSIGRLLVADEAPGARADS